MTPARRRAQRRTRRTGSVAVPFAVMLPVMLGFIGLAIDISMVYARNFELQHLADASAVAAAHELDGTAAGVARAMQKATAAATESRYQIFKRFADGATWSTAALYLSDSPAGVWRQAAGVTTDAVAGPLMYAKVDTTALQALSSVSSLVDTSFLRALGNSASVNAAAVAVAGRIGMHITPLAVCALDTAKLGRRPPVTGPELVEFGYRRGVTYDLLNLNPSGTAPQRFLVDPLTDSSASGSSQHFTAAILKPFICSGTVGFGNLRANAPIHIKPLDASLNWSDWLNSRFGTSSCVRNGAPPDISVQEFSAPYDWMETGRGSAKPAMVSVGGTLVLKTSADVSVAPMDGVVPVAADDFGPLWIYNKPVKYVAGTASGAAEPDPDTFFTSDWADLYPASPGAGDAPAASGYIATPYQNIFLPPSAGNQFADRRVLNLPLLDCSAGTLGSSATVLGIGRFFMTQPATPAALYGEFAGLAAADKLATLVELHK